MVILQLTTEKMKLVIQVLIKNDNSGNDEGTSICGMYTMGNIRSRLLVKLILHKVEIK